MAARCLVCGRAGHATRLKLSPQQDLWWAAWMVVLPQACGGPLEERSTGFCESFEY